MRNVRLTTINLILLAVLALSNAMLLFPAGTLPRMLAACVLMMLPGLAWGQYLLTASDRLLRWTVSIGLSLAASMCLALFLSYLPGPISLWGVLLPINLLTLASVVLDLMSARRTGDSEDSSRRSKQTRSTILWLAIAFFVFIAVFVRFADLGYSEFQGDESLAMISASELLEGHEDALFLRGKGPGEILLPAVFWRLSGTITEAGARLPFTIAGLLIVFIGYLLGRQLVAERGQKIAWAVGMSAAGLLAINGFMVAFSRIVQYQALVVSMSGLALLSAWQWRKETRWRWMALCGIFLGAGLLAHYDAILVVPAIVYVVLAGVRFKSGLEDPPGAQTKDHVLNPRLAGTVLLALFCFLVVAGSFYIPYILDPQAARTGGYLGDRIGHTLIKNNLDSFQHFNVFYTSFYYYAVTGLLVLGYLLWALRCAPGVGKIPGGRLVVPLVAGSVALVLAIWPRALYTSIGDLAFLPFVLILFGVFLSSALRTGERAIVVWLAVPFLGYNFGVALPLTHIYTIVPGWTLTAGMAIAGLFVWASNGSHSSAKESLRTPRWVAYLAGLVVILFAGMVGSYLYTAYLRHDVEFWQDWPDGRLAWHWSPYEDLPTAGFFGLSHRSGWKGVGALYATGDLDGDYSSNEEPDVTSWYMRGAPRACDPNPEYYFLADDLVDSWPVDREQIEANYDLVGRVVLPNNKGTYMFQARPSAENLGIPDYDALSLVFDNTAYPDAFARSARGSQPADSNLGGLVRLIGYDLDANRAWPGGRIAVTLYWQAQKNIPDDYHVFVHLEGEGDACQLCGQADGRPVCWTYPTFDWRPGQVIADQHSIEIGHDLPPGDYSLQVGMYLPDTGQRLDVLDEAGNPVSNFVNLGTVTIE